MYTYIYIHICIHVYIHKYTCIYICMYIYIQCIYIYKEFFLFIHKLIPFVNAANCTCMTYLHNMKQCNLSQQDFFPRFICKHMFTNLFVNICSHIFFVNICHLFAETILQKKNVCNANCWGMTHICMTQSSAICVAVCCSVLQCVAICCSIL